MRFTPAIAAAILAYTAQAAPIIGDSTNTNLTSVAKPAGSTIVEVPLSLNDNTTNNNTTTNVAGLTTQNKDKRAVCVVNGRPVNMKDPAQPPCPTHDELPMQIQHQKRQEATPVPLPSATPVLGNDGGSDSGEGPGTPQGTATAPAGTPTATGPATPSSSTEATKEREAAALEAEREYEEMSWWERLKFRWNERRRLRNMAQANKAAAKAQAKADRVKAKQTLKKGNEGVDEKEREAETAEPAYSETPVEAAEDVAESAAEEAVDEVADMADEVADMADE